MARKHRSKNSNQSYDRNADASASLDSLLSVSSPLATPSRNYFQDDSDPVSYDRRFTDPYGDPPPPGPRRATQQVVRNRQSLRSPRFKYFGTVHSQTKGAIAFAAPSQIPLCKRRKVRREIFFAKKLYRRGRGGPRRRTPETWLSCR